MNLINFDEISVQSGYDYEDSFSGESDESTAGFRYISTILQGVTSTFNRYLYRNFVYHQRSGLT
jgi:hypothetical protein